MNGARREIARQRARLDDTFTRISSIDEDATEARADFAKYLCVRVSGYLETSICALLKELSVSQSSPRIARYLAADLERLQNARKGKIVDLFGKFDQDWRVALERYLVDERSDAIGTIVSNRHKIAHGADSDLTYVRVREHWLVVQRIVDFLADLVDPPPVAPGDPRTGGS